MGKAITPYDRSISLQPRTFSEAVDFSSRIAGTSFVPDSFRNKPEEILAAIQYGSELGLGPLASLNGMAVIKGKVTLYASTMRALVEASGLMEVCRVKFKANPPEATVTVKRVGRASTKRVFNLEDAKNAGLASSVMYGKYPERMYTARAVSYALRDEFADVLQGILASEEMLDGGQIVELEDVGGPGETQKAIVDGSSGVDLVSNSELIKEALGKLDPKLAARIDAGFNVLGWNDANRLVQLQNFQGREGQLLEFMLSESNRLAAEQAGARGEGEPLGPFGVNGGTNE